ncbi:MAG: M56 family metallopeptidase [Oscillospiraceae bacterium]
MESLFYRVAVVSAAVSVVLLPLLLAPRWQKRYAPHTRRAVWLVIAAVLLAAPLLPKSRAPVQITVPERTVTLPAAVPVAPQNGTVAVRPVTPEAVMPETPVQTTEEAAPARTVEWGALLTALWLTGGAAVLLGQGTAYLLARRRVMKRAVSCTEYEQLTAELCPRRSVRFFRVDGLRTPMTLGVFRPVVLLPQGEVRQAAVRHELIHVRRRDVAWKLLLLLACAVHWFNPLVWLLSRRADRDMEASCDAAVLVGGNASERRAYGELLLETTAERNIPLTTQFGGGKKRMKERLYDLFYPGKRSRVLVGAVLLLCLLAGSLVACRSAEPMTADEALRALKESVTYEDGTLSFTIPKEYSPVEDWNIHIAGRAEAGALGGMSLHYLDGEKWEAGKTYTLDITEELWPDMTELTLDVSLGEENRSIDLLAVAGRESESMAIEINGQSYVPLTSYVEELGYRVAVTQKYVGKSEAGQEMIEYRYTLKEEENVVGALTVGVCGDEIFSVMWGGVIDGSNLFDTERDAFVFFEGDVYIRCETPAADAPAEDAGEVPEWYWWGPYHENKKYGFTLRLPASWRDNCWSDGGEDTASFFCSALPEEEGALQKLIVRNKPMAEEELTDRYRLLGEAEGCYVYLYSPSVEADILMSWSEETRNLYQTMYCDMEALPEESLTWWDGYEARIHPVTGEETRGKW